MNITIVPFIVFGLVLILIGIISFFVKKEKTFLQALIPLSIFSLSLATLAFLIIVLKNIDPENVTKLFNWQLPFGELLFGMDSLSGLFLIPLLILTAATSLYGWKYFGDHKQEKTHWFFFTVLVAGMVLVLLSRNAIAFIFSWEIMSVSSFFLVITDKKNEKTMRAGLIYFVTAHFGAALLFIVFFILSTSSGSFNFSSWHNLQLSPFKAGLVFILSLIAFGSKAGFMPFHIWLPLAHPAAPSHVSALMSGIMIKMGIYGLFRILTFIGPYYTWWGILLVAIGAVSGILGVLFAIGQHDIKKLLAYHSVENIGIIMIGFGIGVSGVAYGYPSIAFFGFAGSLLHVINHALFKSLLFLGAGAIIRQTKTGEIDQLGGLIKKMPITAVLFIAGSIAIAGLPFFNGFISELLIYLSSIFGIVDSANTGMVFIALFTGASLALIGGLAVACFTKVIGVVLLGEERTPSVHPIVEVPKSMLLGMIIPALVCVGIGMGSYFVVPILIKPIAIMTGIMDTKSIDLMMQITKVTSVSLSIILALVIIVAFLMKVIFRKKKMVEGVETWGCGYSAPKASMQYTASSFAQPITDHFSIPLNINKKENLNDEFFPGIKWKFHSSTNDWILTKIFEPFISLIAKLFTSLKWLQNGRSGFYVLYIAIAILFLIAWKFFI